MENAVEKIMKYEAVLPEDFDGTFLFTNYTDEEFVGRWGNKEYHFPAKTSSPIVMYNQTPLEIQSIRKKWAKDLAEKIFFNSDLYKKLLQQERNNDGSARLNGIHSAGQYSINELAGLIQRGLQALPAGKAKVVTAEKAPLEDSLSKDDDGELNTIVVKQNSDLIAEKKSLKRKALGE